MDFKKATDRAMELGLRTREIAEAAGVSEASIRAARLPDTSPSKREPPDGWQAALRGLCKRRAGELLALAKRLKGT